LVFPARPITPAAELLLGKFHPVEEQVRQIRDDLMPGSWLSNR
jgi:hypothetical protein